MTPQTATIAYILGILALFALDRDRNARTSIALWIPTLWLMITGSRAVSQWLAIVGLGDGRVWFDSPDQYLDGSPMDRNVYTLLLVFGLLVLVGRRRNVGRLLRANVPILLFYLYCAASILWSDFPDVAFKRWIKYVGDLVMVMVVLTDPYRSAAVKRLLARVGFVLVPVSILLIKFYGDLGRVFDSLTGEPSYSGVTMGKNLLGTICAIYGIGAVWRFFQGLRGRKRPREIRPLLAQGVLLAMVLWLFWRANAMTSLSCFLIGSALLAATNLRAVARRPWVVHLLVTGLLTVTLSIVYFGAGATALQTIGRDATLTGRTEIWHQAIHMTPNLLLGAGFESFWLGPRLQKMWDLHWWHPNEAHNGYIEVFLNLGWVGVVLLAVLLATGYRNIMAAFRVDRDAGRLRLAYFVVAIVFNFTESAIKPLSSVGIVFFLVIMAAAKASVPKVLLPVEIDRTGALADYEPQVDHALPQEGI